MNDAMTDDDMCNPDSDPFKPPAIPTEVFCLHCQREYDSYLIHYVVEEHEGRKMGFWCCPTPECDGKGFGFDIFPTDPDYINEDGEKMWFDDDDEDFEDEEDDDETADFDEQSFDPPTDTPDQTPDPDRHPRRIDDDDIPW